VSLACIVRTLLGTFSLLRFRTDAHTLSADSLLYLPLADATVITFLAPSLACWACSYLINEPFTRMEQIAAYVSLFGVVLIARPTSLFSSSSAEAPTASGDGDMAVSYPNSTTHHADASNYDNVTPAQRAGAVGIAMIGVLGAAVAYTTIRWIGKRAHPLISVNYFAAWCTLVSIVMMLSLPGVGFLLPSNLKEWGYLFFLGICGFVMVRYSKFSLCCHVTTQTRFSETLAAH
jgi:drug/metabolite transporter (DMT)-like permease